ncbi:hypothetical protein E8D34_10645 [Nocardioides sp. GY 10113]|uniref:ADP-ribosylglycohydrolase family protein n=1 Tax=Nocardioides sp. GY 10113 TaxID=2569761 RepID=UPI0010A7B401|nr:ADP-ribosylglycohydrolase family protein [Nocardioides sp. GY 10113]TIC86703.1 hypothetical protein E8D34_10645 [Nocardioides sp. GY 10113]
MTTATNRQSGRNDAPVTWESKVRGLMLGLALGDAIGSRRSDVPEAGTLTAGAATQLAAWTAEGLLRTATRYGGYVVGNPLDVVRHAYQRWLLTRGGVGRGDHWNPVIELDGTATRGWLLDVPAMAAPRGSSPATEKALTSGRPTRSAGCQALLRSLPIAAFVRQGTPAGIDEFAASAASLTHDDGARNAPTGFAVRLAAACLEADGFGRAFDSTLAAGVPETIHGHVDRLVGDGMSQPCVPQLLERIAPDKTAASALAGGVYVALSFPDVDTLEEALEFAGWAPDGDSVAAVAGALLGAIHGVEALPPALRARLELGWVMDTLARDLVVQTTRNQAGDGWKGDGFEHPVDPWWDTKYPGV